MNTYFDFTYLAANSFSIFHRIPRAFMGFGLKDVGCHKEDFFIHDNNGNPSPEYVEASKDFYLRIDLK
jgi:hypothetical protein